MGGGGGGIGSRSEIIVCGGVKVKEEIQHNCITNIFIIYSVDVIVVGIGGGRLRILVRGKGVLLLLSLLLLWIGRP